MKTKKVLENNSGNSCNSSDESSCNITNSESDTGLTIVVNYYKEDKKPMKNKKKVTTEELKKVTENSLVSSDDEKPIKNKKKVFTKKSKKFDENSVSSTSSGDDKDHKKPTKPIKKKKVNTKDIPKKTLVEGNEFKKLQRKAKKTGAKSNRKNNKYVVEYEGKKIHLGSTKYEDYLIHKDLDRRDKYLAKAKKITNKNGDFSYDSPLFPNYWSVKLLN